MDTANTSWVINPTAPTDQRDRKISYRTYGYICNYEGSDRYNWQARRDGALLSGIVSGPDDAMAQADAMLALPIEEFNALAAADLRQRMAELEKELLNLQPDVVLLPGYHAGFEAGMAAMKAKIEAVLS